MLNLQMNGDYSAILCTRSRVRNHSTSDSEEKRDTQPPPLKNIKSCLIEIYEPISSMLRRGRSNCSSLLQLLHCQWRRADVLTPSLREGSLQTDPRRF